MEIPVRDRNVLVDGSVDAAGGLVQGLLAEGARVFVRGGPLPATLADLEQRGLIARHRGEACEVVLGSGASEEPAVPSRPAPRTPAVPGRVTLVGGGPGDPGLLTVAGQAAIDAADVVLVDRLAPQAALTGCRAEIIDVGKIPRGEFTPQEQINRLLIEHARLGRRVVRLKGGDNFVFGRGGEEALACLAAGIAVDVIPGVSSAVAGPALAGIPVTHRKLTQGFTVISGHAGPDDPRSQLDWTALARVGTTLVILMGVATLETIAARLIADGVPADTPAACVADAALASMRVVRAPLSDIAESAEAAGLAAPAVTVIGAVAALDVLGVLRDA